MISACYILTLACFCIDESVPKIGLVDPFQKKSEELPYIAAHPFIEVHGLFDKEVQRIASLIDSKLQQSSTQKINLYEPLAWYKSAIKRRTVSDKDFQLLRLVILLDALQKVGHEKAVLRMSYSSAIESIPGGFYYSIKSVDRPLLYGREKADLSDSILLDLADLGEKSFEHPLKIRFDFQTRDVRSLAKKIRINNNEVDCVTFLIDVQCEVSSLVGDGGASVVCGKFNFESKHRFKLTSASR